MYQTRITAAELPVERLLGEYCFPERFREACRACRTTETIGPAAGGTVGGGGPAAFSDGHVLGMQVFYDAQTRREVSTAGGG